MLLRVLVDDMLKVGYPNSVNLHASKEEVIPQLVLILDLMIIKFL